MRNSPLNVLLLVLLLLLSLVTLFGCEAPEKPCCPNPLACQPAISVMAFSAVWCGPCRDQKPIVDKLERSGVRVHRIDIDKDRAKAKLMNVKAVPDYVVLKGKRIVLRTHDVTEVVGYLGR